MKAKKEVKKAIFYTADRETGTKIDEFISPKDAADAIKKYERDDKRDGTYEPNFYCVMVDGVTYTRYAERKYILTYSENGAIKCETFTDAETAATAGRKARNKKGVTGAQVVEKWFDTVGNVTDSHDLAGWAAAK